MREFSDEEIVKKLIERDPEVTRWFYYVKCRPLFLKLMRRLFNYPIKYDEFVNEVNVFLLENDEYRLRQFAFQSTICNWLRTGLIRYFIHNGKIMIEDTSKESPLSIFDKGIDETSKLNAKIDIERLMKELAHQNKRHEYVIRRLHLDGASHEDVAKELNVKVSNLYNIKKRAMKDLTLIALNQKKPRK